MVFPRAFLILPGAVEFLAKVIERPGELAEGVGPLVGERRIQVARRHFFGEALQPREGPHHRAVQVDGHEREGRNGDERGERHGAGRRVVAGFGGIPQRILGACERLIGHLQGAVAAVGRSFCDFLPGVVELDHLVSQRILAAVGDNRDARGGRNNDSKRGGEGRTGKPLRQAFSLLRHQRLPSGGSNR